MYDLALHSSPQPDAPQGWEALPAEERLRVRRVAAACEYVAAASRQYGKQKQALIAAADQLGIPWATLRRYYDRWTAAGCDIVSLVDRRQAGARKGRSRTSHPGFVAFWGELYVKCQRNAGTARELLINIWKQRKESVPGYKDWYKWPAIPEGWSEQNLRRIAPKKLDQIALRQGIRAAAPLLPQVLSSRVGLSEKEDSTWSARDKAMKLLQDTMRQHELDMDWLYLLAIGKHPHKLMGYTCDSFMDAIRVKLTAQEIMQLMYTVNARGRQKTRKIGDAFDL